MSMVGMEIAQQRFDYVKNILKNFNLKADNVLKFHHWRIGHLDTRYDALVAQDFDRLEEVKVGYILVFSGTYKVRDWNGKHTVRTATVFDCTLNFREIIRTIEEIELDRLDCSKNIQCYEIFSKQKLEFEIDLSFMNVISQMKTAINKEYSGYGYSREEYKIEQLMQRLWKIAKETGID